MRKHMDEWEQKFADFTAEVKARDDHTTKSVQKQSTSTISAASISNSSPPSCSAALSNKYYLRNIKPRRSQILPKFHESFDHLTKMIRSTSNAAIQSDTERKRKSELVYDVPTKIFKGIKNSYVHEIKDGNYYLQYNNDIGSN